MTAEPADPHSGDTLDAQAPLTDGLPSQELRIGWRGLIVIVLFWTFFGIVLSASIFLPGASDDGGDAAPAALVAFTLLGAYGWATLTVPLLYLTQRLNLTGDRRLLRIAAVLVAGVVFSALVSLAVSVMTQALLSDSGLLRGRLATVEGLGVMARYRFPHDLLGCLLVMTAGVARDYFVRYRTRLAETTALRVQLAEARLQVLRAQLNPHFLFNTLNAVAALVQTDPTGVRRMIALLSEMLRETLDGVSEPEVPLERELELLHRYLAIMEIRFRGRLEPRIAADPDVLHAFVPHLILQPLVENAMKHGIGGGTEVGIVEVTASRRGDDLVLAVRDSGGAGPASLGDGGDAPQAPRRVGRGPGGEPRPSRGGFGLRHTRERLRELYGSRASLTLRAIGDDGEDSERFRGGTLVEVRLPYHDRAGAPLGERPQAALASEAIT